MRRRDAVLRGHPATASAARGQPQGASARRRWAGRASATINGARIPVQSLSLMAIIFRPYLGPSPWRGSPTIRTGRRWFAPRPARGRKAGGVTQDGLSEVPTARRANGLGFFRTDPERSADDAAADDHAIAEPGDPEGDVQNVAAAVERIVGHSLDARDFDPAKAARSESAVVRVPAWCRGAGGGGPPRRATAAGTGSGRRSAATRCGRAPLAAHALDDRGGPFAAPGTGLRALPGFSEVDPSHPERSLPQGRGV